MDFGINDPSHHEEQTNPLAYLGRFNWMKASGNVHSLPSGCWLRKAIELFRCEKIGIIN